MKYHTGEYVAHTSGRVGIVAGVHNNGNANAATRYKVKFSDEEGETSNVHEHDLRPATHEEIEKATGGRP